MTFDEWMNEVEVYSTRKERLIEGLMTYRDDHEFVIKWLEAAYNVGYKAGFDSLGIPNYPHIPPSFPTPETQLMRNCSRCGISLTGVMGYVCSDAQCPTFPRVTCVNLGTKSTEGYNG